MKTSALVFHQYDHLSCCNHCSGVGRVIGLCLLTNETCPLHLSRPVLKYILGRVLHWHDFAFYDPTTFEGLRQLLQHTLPDQKEVSSTHFGHGPFDLTLLQLIICTFSSYTETRRISCRLQPHVFANSGGRRRWPEQRTGANDISELLAPASTPRR